MFPVSYLVATVAGGCLGGGGRIYRQFKSRQKSWLRYLGEGCLVGIIIVAATAAGVVITQIPASVVATELGALLIATLGGYAGSPMLDKLKLLVKPVRKSWA